MLRKGTNRRSDRLARLDLPRARRVGWRPRLQAWPTTPASPPRRGLPGGRSVVDCDRVGSQSAVRLEMKRVWRDGDRRLGQEGGDSTTCGNASCASPRFNGNPRRARRDAPRRGRPSRGRNRQGSSSRAPCTLPVDQRRQLFVRRHHFRCRDVWRARSHRASQPFGARDPFRDECLCAVRRVVRLRSRRNLGDRVRELAALIREDRIREMGRQMSRTVPLGQPMLFDELLSNELRRKRTLRRHESKHRVVRVRESDNRLPDDGLLVAFDRHDREYASEKLGVDELCPAAHRSETSSDKTEGKSMVGGGSRSFFGLEPRFTSPTSHMSSRTRVFNDWPG